MSTWTIKLEELPECLRKRYTKEQIKWIKLLDRECSYDYEYLISFGDRGDHWQKFGSTDNDWHYTVIYF